eukprot:603497-Prymnesium_polylepis.1
MAAAVSPFLTAAANTAAASSGCEKPSDSSDRPSFAVTASDVVPPVCPRSASIRRQVGAQGSSTLNEMAQLEQGARFV